MCTRGRESEGGGESEGESESERVDDRMRETGTKKIHVKGKSSKANKYSFDRSVEIGHC